MEISLDPEIMWCRIYDGLNKHVMEENEWELGVPPKAVDFENMGQFEERLGAFFAAFAKALDTVGIHVRASTFTLLPYRQLSSSMSSEPGHSHEAVGSETDPSVYLWRSPSSIKRFTPKSWDDASTCKEVLRELGSPDVAGQGGCIVQIPYFVKPITETRREQFRTSDYIFFQPSIQSVAGVDINWIKTHPISDYVQRFLLIAHVDGDLGMVSCLGHLDGLRLNHLIGAFLSWIGIAADEIGNFQAARVASFQLLRSHQLGNEMSSLFLDFEREVTQFVEGSSESPTLNDAKRVGELLREFRTKTKSLREKVANFTQVMSTIGAPRESVAWYQATQDFMHACGAKYVNEALYEAEGREGFVSPSRFDLSGVQDKSKNALITFSLYHYQELLENLFKNAKRAWTLDGKVQRTQIFRISADLVNGHMNLSFANEGREIEDDLRSKLFRYPVPNEASATKGTGVGLWALGMGFKTFGLPYPTVENDVGFGPCFTFKFPIKTKRQL